jgi:uncharacterized protein with FMN-binding domain
LVATIRVSEKSHPMKKIALSLFVVAASGGYVWSQAGTGSTDAFPDLPPLVGHATAAPLPPSQPAAPVTAPAKRDPMPSTDLADLIATFALDEPSRASAPVEPPPLPAPAAPSPTDAAATAPAEIPIPRPRPAYRPPVASAPPRRQPAPGNGVTRTALTLASGATYADGDYAGPAVDAYYGLVQIEAIVQNGRLASIKVLRYPSDRRTSRFINRQALPILGREVVRAQSARVSIVSGATLTSEAFIRSLDGALRQARA